jgi:hypothetical protein
MEHWLSLQGKFGSNMRGSMMNGKALQDLEWPAEDKTRSTLHATQALLAFYGGQYELPRFWTGLFGGFSAYDFVSCTQFQGGLHSATGIVVAEIRGLEEERPKSFLVQKDTGRVVCGRDFKQACPSRGEDAVLDWFAEYVTRLETGNYQVGRLASQEDMPPVDATILQGILHYPQIIGRGATRTVTRGIEVFASAAYSPFTACFGLSFVFSIRLRLLEPNEDGYDGNRGFDSCQLKSRHWRLLNDEGQTEHVDGDGVVGFYPLLREGSHRADSGNSSDSVTAGHEFRSGTFVYESCTYDSETSFGGYMLFVPGSLAEPTGSAFRVHLDPFPLDTNPEYMY